MRTWLGVGLIALATLLTASQPIPRCFTMDPDSGKQGDIITVTGENLNKGIVAEIYVSDFNANKDTVATIIEQSDGLIKFQVPDVPAGRYHLLFLSSDRSALVQQPVMLTVR